MPAHLLIRDGSPWWLSPDVWVVPGNDPNGTEGSPIAGMPAYLWARVSNTGNVDVSGCRVDFYWADPSAQMVVGVATFIGSAFADIAAGDTQDVLCLVPWTPVTVNGGHECVLAVAHGAGDQNPIPDPLPNGYAFDPPSHDQVAQLNLSVLQASMLSMPLMVFVNAVDRVGKRAQLSVEFGGDLDDGLLKRLGLKSLKPAREPLVEVKFGQKPRCSDPEATRTLKLEVPRGGRSAVFVHIDAQRLPRGHYQLVHVLERSGDKVVGGVSYLVIDTAPERKHSKEEQRQ